MKEKIINYIETLEAKSLQVDDYFKQRNDLYISNQQKDKEIERLNKELQNLEKLNNANYQSFIEVNNIINELEKWLDEEYQYYDKLIGALNGIAMGQINRTKNKLQELKGSDKE